MNELTFCGKCIWFCVKKSRFIEIFKLMSCVALPVTQCKDGMREVIIKSLGP